MKQSFESRPLVIGLAGFGTVGGGLVHLLAENSELTRLRAGRDIVIKRILVRDVKKTRSAALPQGAELTVDATALTDDPQIDALVELIGGVQTAHTLIERAMDKGKHIITANKALLAEQGADLFKKAADKNLALRYEAAVAGAIPIVQTLKESLAGNRVISLLGILNGTSNYILSEMTTNNVEFNLALEQAQALGYAEADPTLDIDGHDAAHKLALLIRLAYGVNYPYNLLPVRGIRHLSAMDIRLAGEFGYRIKLIGHAREVADSQGATRLEAGIFPALVHNKYLLAKVSGVYNAVRLEANGAGSLFFHGRGAGDLPTAGAVLSDIVAVARNDQVNNTGFARQNLPMASVLPQEEGRSSFYARLTVQDRPGVLRDLAGAMADQGVSVAQMIQKSGEGDIVPLVFMTHETTARAMSNSLKRMEDAGLLTESAVCYRVL